jgi:hypothetical protein
MQSNPTTRTRRFYIRNISDQIVPLNEADEKQRRIELRRRIYDVDFMREEDDNDSIPTNPIYSTSVESHPQTAELKSTLASTFIQRSEIQQEPYEIVEGKYILYASGRKEEIKGFNKKFPNCEGCKNFCSGQSDHMGLNGCLSDELMDEVTNEMK